MSNENTQGAESTETSEQLVLVLSTRTLSVVLTSLVAEKVRCERIGSSRSQKVKQALDEFTDAWSYSLADAILMNGLPNG